MIKNYIFDIGNVIVSFDPVSYFEKRLPKKKMDYACSLVFNEDWEKLDEGIYTGEQIRQRQLKKHPAYYEQIQFIHDHWLEMMSLKEDTISYLKELKRQGNAIYLLSNIGEESHAYLQAKYGFFDLVDGMVLSYEERLLKPDVRIYQRLLEKYNLQAKECMFFDDKKENIATAKTLGMHGVVFEHLAQVKKEVEHVINQ